MNSLIRVLSVLVVCAAMPRHAPAAETPEIKAAPIIVFMTDFGTLDDAVAICKGVMLSLAPDARIVDLTHQVPPYSIADGARFLARTSLYYPANTIFVGVVDPGVGTQRHPVIVKTRRGQFFVVPDNGLLTPIEDRDGIDGAREITNAGWMLPGPHSATFHGRDIFSAAAGHLARGEDWSAAGPALPRLARLSIAAPVIGEAALAGHVIGFDGPYGNLITDIKRAQFAALGFRLGDTVAVTIGGKQFQLPFVTTFGDVPVGKPLLYIDSSELVSVAINQASFAQVHDIAPPAPFLIARAAKKPH
jgi:S-adenosyl-L-methionine hydrolase (adenosine-forming)